jgi:hypothetical protein
MAEDQRRPILLLIGHSSDRCELPRAFHDEGRQVFVGEGLSEVTAVATDDERPGLGTHPDGLMARCVPIGQQAGHCAITEQVMIAGDLHAIVSVIHIGGVVRAAGDQLFVVTRGPLRRLDHDARVDEFVETPNMIEVKMRDHDVIDLVRIEASHSELRRRGTRSVAGQMHAKSISQRAEPRRVDREIAVETGVDHDEPPRMLDQEHRHGVGQITRFALEEPPES